MNYYPFHLGDYAARTAHLEPMEDLAYRRMLDLYYRTERPLPEPAEVARLIRMRDHEATIRDVLNEFFTPSDEGYRHPRCDAEIAAFKAMAEGGRKGAAKRWGKPPHSPPIATPCEPQCQPEPEPEPKETHTEDSATVGAPSAAGRACLLLRKSGIAGVSPGHPKLLALLAAGVTDEELTHAAQSAVAKGKGFAYAMGALEAQRREAAEMTLHAGPLPGKAAPAPNAALSAERTAAMLAEQASRTPEAPSDAIREKLKAAKGVAALAGLAMKVAA